MTEDERMKSERKTLREGKDGGRGRRISCRVREEEGSKKEGGKHTPREERKGEGSIEATRWRKTSTEGWREGGTSQGRTDGRRKEEGKDLLREEMRRRDGHRESEEGKKETIFGG